MDKAGQRRVIILLGLATLLLVVARFFLLGADPPPWFAPDDVRLHTDEGVKTIAARNLAEWGATRWNEQDEYPGWFTASPGTQWLYYTAYSLGGVRLISVRFVAVLLFALWVGAFVSTFHRAYPSWAVAAGAFLVAVEPIVFQFSRVALLEMPLAFVTGLGLLAIFLSRERSLPLQLLLVIAVATVAWRLVKPSGFLYLSPAIVALLGLQVARRSHDRRWLLVMGAVALGSIGVIAFETRGIWMLRAGSAAFTEYPHRLLTSAPQALSPFSMAAALLCIAHGVSTRPGPYLADTYRLALVATVLGVPLVLAAFHGVPPSYFPAMMIAVPLLVIDHLARGPWQWLAEAPAPIVARLFVGGCCVLLAWYAVRILDYAILTRLPLPLGDTPGIEAETMVGYFPPIALGALAAGIWLHRWIARPALFRPVFGVLCLGFVGFGLETQIRTFTSPTFDSNSIRSGLMQSTESGASVAGDWSPYLTLGTGRKALYVNDWFNRAERFENLRPAYFLSAQTPYDLDNLKVLVDREDILVGAPRLLGRFLGRAIELYPLTYPDDARGDGSDGRMSL